MGTVSTLLSVVIVLCATVANADTLALGDFRFDSRLFGDAVVHSTILAPDRNWLNVVNVYPGSITSSLTGANFNTGMSSLGFAEGNPEFVAARVISYNTPIVNHPGADFGIVMTTPGSFTPILTSVSIDGINYIGRNGVDVGTVGSWDTILAAGDNPPGVSAPIVDSGVVMNYFFGDSNCDNSIGSSRPCDGHGIGPFPAHLFVEPIDLSAFGLPDGARVSDVRVYGQVGFTLVRVAGLESAAVPAPSSLFLLGSGLVPLAVWWRWQREERADGTGRREAAVLRYGDSPRRRDLSASPAGSLRHPTSGPNCTHW